MRRRRSSIALAFGLLVAFVGWAAPSAAQPWPQRTVKFIVPLGPGSGVDIGARLFADRLTARWGQPVVVENRPGGDGIVAINAFVSGRDDHTLLRPGECDEDVAVFLAIPLFEATSEWKVFEPDEDHSVKFQAFALVNSGQ